MTKKTKIITISASLSLAVCIILVIIFYERMKQSIKGTITGNYFSDKELYHSATAKKYNLDNTPTQEAWKNLYALRDNILNPAREKYGSCIYINCAYRCPAVNNKVGGASTSQHLTGHAADITTKTPKGNIELFKILVELGNFDQLIWEGNGTWIHVSYDPTKQRGQMLKQLSGNKYQNINQNWQTAIA